MPRDPVQPFLQAAVYVVLYSAPLFFFGWLFLYVGNVFAGSVFAILFFALFGNLLCLRIFDGVAPDRALQRLGLPLNRLSLHNSGSGLALGFAAAAFVVLVPLLIGFARETATAHSAVNWREQLFVPALLLVGAAGEEILFRGFGFQVLLRAFSPFAVLLPTGVLFGLLHGANPHASPFGIVNTIGFGVLFGFAFLRSHDIWFPLGLHFGWNLTLLLFGADISGLTMRITTYEIAWKGSALWSGGAYGPEASLTATCALALLAVAVWKVRVLPQQAYLIDCPRREE